MTTTASWYRRLFGPSLLWGLGLPLLLIVLQVFGTTGAAHREFEQTQTFGLDWFGYLLLVAGPLLLTVRWRWPVPVLLGVIVLSLTYVLLDYVYGPFVLSVIVAVVHAVKTRHRVVAWTTFVGMLVVHFAVSFARGEGPSTTQVGAITGWVLVVLASAEVARGISERREVRAKAREVEEASRITEERLRIARELHDVVAHNISLINVQAGTALHLMDRRPEHARTALATIKQSSKDTLVELRSILGVLRQADSDELGGPEQPAPGLARLGSLLENARRAGLIVDLRSDDLGTLPGRVDLAAYRILQEAITNVIRHARATRVQISLERMERTEGAGPDSDAGTADLLLRVIDDGTAPPSDAFGPPGSGSGGHPGSHSGLVGMRERAEALGGSLWAGPRSDSTGSPPGSPPGPPPGPPAGSPAGFEVSARLPMPVEGEG